MKKIGRPRKKAGRPKKDKHNNLFKLRDRVKISIPEAKSKLGINESTLYRYESGLRTPSIEIAQKMCLLYGCTLEEIFSKTS